MGKWVCKNCETENDESVSICSLCGAKRDAQYTDHSEQSVSPYHSQRQTNGNQYKNQQPSDAPVNTQEPVSNGDELRALIKKYDSQKNLFKGLLIVCVFIQLVLFACPYVIKYDMYIGYEHIISFDEDFTIYKNCIGIKADPIELICSILLVCITIAPVVAVCVKLNVRKRNLPITISVIAAILTTIYSVVLLFGCYNPSIVPAFFIANVWGTVVFAVSLVKTLDKLDNAMYRPAGF